MEVRIVITDNQTKEVLAVIKEDLDTEMNAVTISEIVQCELLRILPE